MPDYGRFCPVSAGHRGPRRPLDAADRAGAGARQHPVQRHRPRPARASPARCSSSGCATSRARAWSRRWPSPTGRGSEYHLTPAGKDLERVIDALGRWAVEWLFDDLHPHDVDPHTLMWWMHRRIDPSALPRPPGGHRVRAHRADPKTIWLVLDRGEASVCLQHPGFDTDVLCVRPPRRSPTSSTDCAPGRTPCGRAPRGGRAAEAGPRLPRWFLWSPWAEVTRERVGRA